MRVFIVIIMALVHSTCSNLALAQESLLSKFQGADVGKIDLDDLSAEAKHCLTNDPNMKAISTELTSLVDGLGSQRFSERESAQNELSKLLFSKNDKGEVRVALLSALKSDDAEVRHRSRDILEECQKQVYKNISDCHRNYSFTPKIERPIAGMVVIAHNIDPQNPKTYYANLCSEINGELLTSAMNHVAEMQKVAPAHPSYSIYSTKGLGNGFEPFKHLVQKNCCRMSETGPVQMGPLVLYDMHHDNSPEFEANFRSLCNSEGYLDIISIEANHPLNGEVDIGMHLKAITDSKDYYCKGRK